jgi:hypothetical protein
VEACEIPSEDMLLPRVVNLELDDSQCEFDCAKEAAIAEARSYDNAPQLVSWFDKKGQHSFPEDECCVEGEPSWLAYGAAHGADLTVDVNREDYVFMFRLSHGEP